MIGRRPYLPPLRPHTEQLLAFVRQHPEGMTIADCLNGLNYSVVADRLDTLVHHNLVERREVGDPYRIVYYPL